MQLELLMYLKIVGWEGMDWIHLAQDWNKWHAAVGMLMKLWIPHNVGNFSTTQETVGWNW